MENPYSQSDFKVDTIIWNTNITVISIEFPNPKLAPLCFASFMIFSNDFSKLGYYTVECGSFNNAFLCGWSQDGAHLNFGDIPKPIWNEDSKEALKQEWAEKFVEIFAQNNGLSPKKD